VLVVLTVSEVSTYLKETIESDDLLQDLWVRGEVSNLVLSQAGHMYFTLKDAQSQLRCVIFRGQLSTMPFRPQNGISIVGHGRLSVYEVSGQVQLYMDLVQPQGIGALYLKFERLRRQLEAEGLFDSARKRPLPRFPRRIGVVTSPTGAALRDIVKVIGRRFPSVEVLIAPTLVQGDAAVSGITAALAALNRLGDVDVIVLARGGGSIEDLWPFNEEAVARAIFASRVPVVSGVGHETDVTIADLVADLRAPTPSAAAELVVPSRQEYLGIVGGLRQRSGTAVATTLAGWRYRVEMSDDALRRMSPPPRVLRLRQQVDDYATRAEVALTHRLEMWQERVRSRALQLTALDPAAVLQRGFSVCWHVGSGRTIRNIAQVRAGDGIQVQVADGSFPASVGSSTDGAASLAP
jgi:exodeoxyribonuclease VII large subunit